MKKYILIFGLVGIVALLSSFTFRTNDDRNDVDVVARTIDGHKYIITTTYSYYAGRPGGVAIIHAESCSCKKKQSK